MITATTPLPDGWGSFCSNPDRNHHAHWYATAPWHVDTVLSRTGGDMRELALKLVQTVHADTWPQLHQEVTAQAELYAYITQAPA